MFIDEAVFKGHQTPPHYNSIVLDKIKPRIYVHKLPEVKDKEKVTFKIEKDNSPSPASYKNVEGADYLYRKNI